MYVCVPKARLRRIDLEANSFVQAQLLFLKCVELFNKCFFDEIPVSGARLSHAGA